MWWRIIKQKLYTQSYKHRYIANLYNWKHLTANQIVKLTGWWCHKIHSELQRKKRTYAHPTIRHWDEEIKLTVVRKKHPPRAMIDCSSYFILNENAPCWQLKLFTHISFKFKYTHSNTYILTLLPIHITNFIINVSFCVNKRNFYMYVSICVCAIKIHL